MMEIVELEDLAFRLASLQEENARLRAALEFYATSKVCVFRPNDRLHGPINELTIDRGERAREALKENK